MLSIMLSNDPAEERIMRPYSRERCDSSPFNNRSAAPKMPVMGVRILVAHIGQKLALGAVGPFSSLLTAAQGVDFGMQPGKLAAERNRQAYDEESEAEIGQPRPLVEAAIEPHFIGVAEHHHHGSNRHHPSLWVATQDFSKHHPGKGANHQEDDQLPIGQQPDVEPQSRQGYGGAEH